MRSSVELSTAVFQLINSNCMAFILERLTAYPQEVIRDQLEWICIGPGQFFAVTLETR